MRLSRAWKVLAGLAVSAVCFLNLLAYFFYRDFVLKPQKLWESRNFEANGADTVAATRIPHIIHWGWKDEMVGFKYIKAIESFRMYHPEKEWKAYYWTDLTAEQFVRDKFPQYLDLYLSYPRNIQRADMIRYMLLHHYGGVYADLDFRWYKSMDRILEDKHAVLCPEIPLHSELLINHMTQIVMNAWMASEPKHPFWLKVIEQAKINKAKYDAIHDRRVVVSTGPVMVQNAYEALAPKDTITMLPYETFYSQMDRSAFSEVQRGCQRDQCITGVCRQLCALLAASPDSRLPMSDAVIGEHLWYHTWTRILGLPYYWISDMLKAFGIQDSLDIRTITPVEMYPDIEE